MSSDLSEIIPQPKRPRLPLRVPVEAELGGALVRAEVLGSTTNVLLLEAPEGTSLPSLGTPVRLRLLWDRQVLNGRIAAHGVGGRFLVSVGERAIRRSRRFTVDLAGFARSAQIGAADVRITDLSTGGARVEGIDLPIGAEIELRFTPPGRGAPITVLGFVVRAIGETEPPGVGVAFRLVQPSMDVLGNSPLAAPASV
jgi:PilZ domain